MGKLSRRQLLTLIGTGSITGVAGCDQQQTGRRRDRPPEIKSYTGKPTDQAGELQVSLSAKDDEALRRIGVTINGRTLQDEVPDQEKDATFPEQVLSAGEGYPVTPFERNEVTYWAEDTAGNTTTETEDVYVRKYDRMEDTRLDVSARYIPFAADALGRCLDDVDVGPTIGDYGTGNDNPIPATVTSQHIDQMTGHGITKMTFVFNGNKERAYDYVRELVESDLLKQIAIEPSYTKLSLLDEDDKNWKTEVLPKHLSFLRENLLSRENASRYDNRPTLHTWNIVNLAYSDKHREKIMEEFGSFEAFVEDMRKHLRVEGVDSFLVAGTGSIDTDLFHDSNVNELVTQFDATSPWAFGDLDPDEKSNWGDTFDKVEKVFRVSRKFADEYGMEFIPTVFPGFNDKRNTCHNPPGRYLPRSEEQFRKVLELAEEYRSTDMVNIATWNDWVEGTQIEPGSYRGDDYETDYLEIVETFQSDSAV